MKASLNTEYIEKKFASFEQRIIALEAILGRELPSQEKVNSRNGKLETVAEYRRRVSPKNGQQAVALIVGYYEKVLKQGSASIKDIEIGWRDGKFDGKFHSELLRRAVKDGLIRQQSGGLYDLSGTGESFFDEKSSLNQ